MQPTGVVLHFVFCACMLTQGIDSIGHHTTVTHRGDMGRALVHAAARYSRTFQVYHKHFAMDEDDYLGDQLDQCSNSSAVLGCAKYKALKFVFDSVSPNNEFFVRAASSGRSQSGAGIHLVDLPGGYNGSPLFTYPYIESRDGDSELSKVFKFLLRQLDRFMRYHAITVPVEVIHNTSKTFSSDTPLLVETSRAGEAMSVKEGGNNHRLRRDLAILLSLLALAKLIGIKFLLGAILLGQLVMKKMMVLAGMILPHLIANRCRGLAYTQAPSYANFVGYDNNVESSNPYPYVLPWLRPATYRSHRDKWTPQESQLDYDYKTLGAQEEYEA